MEVSYASPDQEDFYWSEASRREAPSTERTSMAELHRPLPGCGQVDPSLGNPALQNAQDLLNDADRVVAANDTIFGTTGGPVSVIVFALGGATDGTGGADHMGCDYETGAACARLLSRRQRPSRQLRWQTVARSGPGA